MVNRFLSIVLVCAVSPAALLKAADAPRPAPEFSVGMMDGTEVRLSQQKGKVVCLLFILTTCPHCQKLIGAMSKLQTEFGPRGLETIAASVQDMPKLYLPDFVKQFHPPFAVGFAGRDLAMQFMQHDPKYIFYSPSLTLIDREGVIQAQFPGGDAIFNEDREKNLRARIEPLLLKK